MDLNRYGLINTRLKGALRVLTLLANGWAFGLALDSERRYTRALYHPGTGAKHPSKFPTLHFERLKKGKYLTRHGEIYALNRRGMALFQRYQEAAFVKSVDVTIPQAVTTIKVNGVDIADPKRQLGRPTGNRAGFWDRGFIAGMTQDAPECPYGQETEQARGFARVWLSGLQRARALRLGS
jgi:hypothetical protein